MMYVSNKFSISLMVIVAFSLAVVLSNAQSSDIHLTKGECAELDLRALHSITEGNICGGLSLLESNSRSCEYDVLREHQIATSLAAIGRREDSALVFEELLSNLEKREDLEWYELVRGEYEESIKVILPRVDCKS